MSENITVKIQPNGLSLHINENVDFQDLVKEVESKFADNAKFYKQAKMTISFEGKKLTELEERKIVDVITKNSDLDIICIIDKNEQNNEVNLRALQKYSAPDLNQYCRFYSKRMTPSQILESESNLVILGDVLEDCTVIAAGNIIVLGSIYGEVYAGVDSKQYNNFVIALDFQPVRMEINKIKYKPDKKHKINKKYRDKPQIAYVDGIRIALDAYTNELPNFIN